MKILGWVASAQSVQLFWLLSVHSLAVIIVSAELPSCLGCAQRDGGHDGAVKEDKLPK